MNAILQQMLMYFAVFLIGVLLIGFLQRGFFLTWLRARFSNGKKVMITCYGNVKPYYRLGRIVENKLIFKDRHSKDERGLFFDDVQHQTHYDLGVYFVSVNTIKNCIYNWKEDAKAVTGFDAEKNESLCIRHLYRPSLLDAKTQLMIWILVFLCLVVLFMAYTQYKQGKLLMVVLEQVVSLKSTVFNGTSNVIIGG